MEGRWVQIEQGPVPLRCWWNNPQKESKYVVLVLPEVFGVNSWVRSVVDTTFDFYKAALKRLLKIGIKKFLKTNDIN